MTHKKEGPASSEAPTQKLQAHASGLRSPRQVRLIAALLERECVTREEADRIAGSSNSPSLFAALRFRYGLSISCERMPIIDRDGEPAQRGVYHLADDSRARAALLLARSRGS